MTGLPDFSYARIFQESLGSFQLFLPAASSFSGRSSKAMAADAVAEELVKIGGDPHNAIQMRCGR